MPFPEAVFVHMNRETWIFRLTRRRAKESVPLELELFIRVSAHRVGALVVGGVLFAEKGEKYSHFLGGDFVDSPRFIMVIASSSRL